MERPNEPVPPVIPTVAPSIPPADIATSVNAWRPVANGFDVNRMVSRTRRQVPDPMRSGGGLMSDAP